MTHVSHLKSSHPEDVLNYPRCHLEMEQSNVCDGIFQNQDSAQINLLLFNSGLTVVQGPLEEVILEGTENLTNHVTHPHPHFVKKAGAGQLADSGSRHLYRTSMSLLSEKTSTARVVITRRRFSHKAPP